MGSGGGENHSLVKAGTEQAAFPDFLTRRIFAKQLAL
jgi:hypothetical protein